MEWTQRYPGLPAMVPAIRAFVHAMLAESPRWQDAELIASELAANSLRHSGLEGGEVGLRVISEPGFARIEVSDRGVGNWRPEPSSPDAEEESGRGLLIVSEYADKFGHDRLPDAQTVWAELIWPEASPP